MIRPDVPVIMGCGNRKGSRPARAIDLYLGSYFMAGRRWISTVARLDQVYILSAKYGLVRASQMLEPYNLRMGQPGSISSAGIAEQIKAHDLGDATPLLVGMGKAYVARLQGLFRVRYWLTEYMDLPGNGMGYQAQWLKANRGRLPTKLQHLTAQERTLA